VASRLRLASYLVGCVPLLGLVLACNIGASSGGPPEARRLLDELNQELQFSACPAHDETARARLAEEQSSRAEIEVLRMGVDSRAAFRAARAAALAQACSEHGSPAWASRKARADQQREHYLGRVRQAVYKKSLAARARDRAGEAQALRSALGLIDQAAPRLAERLRAEARLLEVKRK
jgi:hypothetical protein